MAKTGSVSATLDTACAKTGWQVLFGDAKALLNALVAVVKAN